MGLYVRMWNLHHYLAKSAQSWLSSVLFGVLSINVSKRTIMFFEGYIGNIPLYSEQAIA